MDPVTSLGISPGLGTSMTAPAQAQSVGALGPDAFLGLMVAQMRHQDPLAPSDANQMMSQTSMLAQTELLSKVATSQQALLGLQRAEVATDLVGTQVKGVAADGEDVGGVVDAVRFSATGPLLVVGTHEVRLEDAYQFGSTTSTIGPPDDTAPVSGGGTDPVAAPLTRPTG